MPAGVYANPYTAETPVGAGLQNIALALFRGNSADRAKQALETEHGGVYSAQAEHFRQQAAKENVERRLAERLLRDQSPDAQDELIGAASGVPAYTVRGYRDTLAGSNPGRSLSDYDEVAPKMKRAMLAIRPAYADKTINPVNIAQALDQLDKTDMRTDAIEGRRSPMDVARGFFSVSGHAPYQGGEGGSTDLMTGNQTLNPLGAARARDQNALAGQHEDETRTGVKIGAPVVIDSEAGPVFSSPRGAIGQNPGLNPNSAAARPRVNADGSSVTDTDLKPLKIGKNDEFLINGGIDTAAGGKVEDPAVLAALSERAQRYYATPGSPAYGVHAAAGRLAVQDVMPNGAELQGTYGFRKLLPKGAANLDLGPVPITQSTTTRKTVTKGGASAPGAAAATTVKPPVSSTRPAGKTDQQLIDEANAAIKKGADRGAVMKRLQAWGVQLG